MNLFIATPMYGGMATEGYVHSLMNTSSLLTNQNIKFGLSSISNESFIIRARDKMATQFLSTQCTHLFFIDADIEFNPQDILRLAQHNKDIVCGAYPIKGYNFQNAIQKNFTHPEHLRHELTQYVVCPQEQKDEQGNNTVCIENGLIKLLNAGTGFMCIKRSVIEKMTAHYTDTICTHEMNGPQYYGLFHPFIDDDGTYLSEDYAFCRRWQQIGGEVWLDPQVVLNHIGTHSFQGQKLM